MSIDLRNCKPGDKLLSKHGLVLEYVKALPENHYMDHEVRYPNEAPYFGSTGTRTHDGFVFRKSRLDTDQDITEILQNETPKVTSIQRTVEQIKDDIITNYKEQIEILKSINDTNNRLIKAYEAREEGYEKYTTGLKEQLVKVQQLYLGLL